MSTDHLQFLSNNFISDYEEAVAEFNEFPLYLCFHDILEVLDQKRISSSTPIVMKNSQYELKFTLAECVMLAGKEREHRTQNKKSLFGAHYVKKKWFLFWTKRQLVLIKERLLQYLIDGDVADETERPLSSSFFRVRRPWEFPDFNPTAIHRFNDHLHKIEALLLEPPATNSMRTIGIVGVSGSGKTALAQLAFHSPRVRKSFSPMLWVDLPQYPDLRCILVDFLNCLASDFSCDLDDLNGTLHNMHNYLLNKKYLIVLDNMWDVSENLYYSKFHMEDTYYYTLLWLGLPRGSGGAIIVTSRLKEVASNMVGELNLYQLKPILDKESCWSIILDSIGEKISDHPILPKMKDYMAERCDGLPLAAKTLAEIISTEFLKDIAIKMFRLVFDKPVTPKSELLKNVRFIWYIGMSWNK